MTKKRGLMLHEQRSANTGSAIELVAGELLKSQRLTCDEIMIIIEIADGEGTLEDLDRFRLCSGSKSP
jgi:hypothetical protein